jgi:hypothetical protein
MPAQRIKRRVVLEKPDETGDISHKLPKWHSISAQFNYKEDSILDVNSPYQPSTFYIHRKECIQSRCDRQWNRVRERCNLAKATISYKFQNLHNSRDLSQQQTISTEIVKEIDTILHRQHGDVLASIAAEGDANLMEAEKQKRDEELQAFATTWNFSHIAEKVISARRHLKTNRPTSLVAFDSRQSLRTSIDKGSKGEFSSGQLNADDEDTTTSSVLTQAQELVANCMESIIRVASSLSEDALSSYPGAELCSMASVLGFELKTVAGSRHSQLRQQNQFSHHSSHNPPQSHQRMFFVLRFDLREYRKVQTTAIAHQSDRQRLAERGADEQKTSYAGAHRPTPPESGSGGSVEKSSIHSLLPGSSSTITTTTSRSSLFHPDKYNGHSHGHTLRDRAKDILKAADTDLLRKARRRIRLESVESVTVKRSLLALSAFHTALCVLLSSVDIDPPPFPDTFLFGAVEEAALAHHHRQQIQQKQQLLPQNSILSRWFTPKTGKNNNNNNHHHHLHHRGESAVQTNDSAVPFSSRGGDEEARRSALDHAQQQAINADSFKDACDQLQSYLNDVLALYEHVDEMLTSQAAADVDVDVECPERKQPSKNLWQVAAQLAQLLRELLVAADTAEALIGSFIVRPSPSPSAPADSSTPHSNIVLGSNSNSHAMKTQGKVAQYEQQLLQQQAVGEVVRSFWSAALPRAALTVRFSGGSFGAGHGIGTGIGIGVGVGVAGKRSTQSAEEGGGYWDEASGSMIPSNGNGNGKGRSSITTHWQGGEHEPADLMVAASTTSTAPGAASSSTMSEDSRRGHQNLLKSYDEADLLRVQLSRCLGCGETLSSSLFGLGKNYSMCQFFGALFCQRWCHAEEMRPIPMRVLHQWDCRPRKVCKLAAAYIDRVRDVPLIRVREANPLLLEGVPKLKRTMSVQQMLRTSLLPRSLWSDSEALLMRLSDLLPRRGHLVLADGLFSLEDLLAVESDGMRHLLQCVVEELMYFKTPRLPLSTPLSSL